MLRRLAGLGIAAILLVALLYLFALNQVADTTAPAMARELDDTLELSLAPGARSRVTMMRDGTGTDAPRTYTARLRPSPRVAADPAASRALCARASEIVARHVAQVQVPVTLRCVAEDEGGKALAEVVVSRGADPRTAFTAGAAAAPAATPSRAAEETPR
jgi:hypothetical protein